MNQEFLDFLYEEKEEATTVLSIANAGENSKDKITAKARLSRVITAIGLYIKMH